MTGATKQKRAASFDRGLIPPSGRKTRATAVASSQKGRFYKPLPKQFRRDGFTYRQIAREGEAAIYEQKWGGCSGPSVSYEVIRLRRRDAFWVCGRFVEAAEVCPNSEAWGADGFTVTDKKAAFRKLREIATSFHPKKEAELLQKSPT